MDDSVYDPNQTNMITFTGPAVTSDDQPTSFGPAFFDVLASIAKSIGGAQYLIGMLRPYKYVSHSQSNRA